MRRIIYRYLADYYYQRAAKYELVLKTFENQKNWVDYLRNTGSMVIHRDKCLGKAKYYINKLNK